MPRRLAARRAFLLEHVALSDARVLEIGALNSPTLAGFEGVSVAYADWFSHEELVRRHADNPRRRPGDIVKPTYVVKDKRWSSVIREEFDLVIANHVFEHIPDPIAWLEEVDRVVRPGGSVLLSIPDRRYTFDYLRPVSTVADLVRAHRGDFERPDLIQFLEATFYHRPVKAPDLWSDDPPRDKLARGRFRSLGEAIENAEARTSDYADCHCHVFESHSFPRLLDDLHSADLNRWRVIALADVEAGHNEFRVILRRDAR